MKPETWSSRFDGSNRYYQTSARATHISTLSDTRARHADDRDLTDPENRAEGKRRSGEGSLRPPPAEPPVPGATQTVWRRRAVSTSASLGPRIANAPGSEARNVKRGSEFVTPKRKSPSGLSKNDREVRRKGQRPAYNTRHNLDPPPLRSIVTPAFPNMNVGALLSAGAILVQSYVGIIRYKKSISFCVRQRSSGHAGPDGPCL